MNYRGRQALDGVRFPSDADVKIIIHIDGESHHKGRVYTFLRDIQVVAEVAAEKTFCAGKRMGCMVE